MSLGPLNFLIERVSDERFIIIATGKAEANQVRFKKAVALDRAELRTELDAWLDEHSAFNPDNQ